MPHYTEIDSAVFEAFLANQGFYRTTSHNEVVYVKEHLQHIWIKIYTSIAINSDIARDVGKDAIRCVAIFQKAGSEKSYPLFKSARIYRTTSQESVHARTADRIALAAARCNAWAAEQASKQMQDRRRSVVNLQPENNRRNIMLPSNTSLGEHYGKLGDCIRIAVKVETRKEWTDKFIFTMVDAQDHTFVYFSDKDLLKCGEMYDLGCKVVAHNTFNGRRQSEISAVIGKRIVM